MSVRPETEMLSVTSRMEGINAVGTKGVESGQMLSRGKLLSGYDVYIFYIPQTIGVERYMELKTALRKWGMSSGNNLLVGFWNQADPDYELVTRMFGIARTPTIIITGNESKASIDTGESGNNAWKTAFVRIDNQNLVSNFELISKNLDEMYHWYLRGEIKEALEKAKKDGWKADILHYAGHIKEIVENLKITLTVAGQSISFEKALGNTGEK